MRFPLDIVKLITSYLPSKQLLPLMESIVTAPEAQKWKPCFWGNPNVFEAGIFSESELSNAPMHVIAGNPACSSFVLSHWNVFQHCTSVWRNPCLWEHLKPHLMRGGGADYRQLAKNPHPEAILYLQEIRIPLSSSNPGYVFKTTEFEYREEKRVGCYTWGIWANPSAVPVLKEIVSNQGQPLYAWLRENPHPWAVHTYLKHLCEDTSFQKYHHLADLFQNEGIFEAVDFRELQVLLLEIDFGNCF